MRRTKTGLYTPVDVSCVDDRDGCHIAAEARTIKSSVDLLKHGCVDGISDNRGKHVCCQGCLSGDLIHSVDEIGCDGGFGYCCAD